MKPLIVDEKDYFRSQILIETPKNLNGLICTVISKLPWLAVSLNLSRPEKCKETGN